MTSHGSVMLIDVDFLEDKEAFEHWYSRMSDYRKSKIDRLKPETSKRTSLGAGILFTKMLEQQGITEYKLGFEKSEKPYLEGATDLYFNLSHSGSKAVCAFSDAPLGVDIEENKAFSDTLVKRIYKEEEIKYIKKHSKSREEEDAFYTSLWTVKESLMKYTGRGISMDPSRILIDMEDGYRAYYDGERMKDLFFRRYEVPGYQLTVCSEYDDFSDDISFFDGRF